MKKYSFAVLLSGSGSNLQALLDAQAAGTIDAEIALVLTDRPDAYGLQRALGRGLPAACVPLPRAPAPEDRAAVRAAWERRLLAVLNAFDYDLVLLSGFMRVLSAEFLAGCRAPVINQHPALLPDPGRPFDASRPAPGGDTVITSAGLTIPALRGAHVVGEALRRGLPVTGCTIHRVTPAVDDGPVLASAEVPILPGDTEDTLHERIKIEERRLAVEVVARLAGTSDKMTR
jgi:phosphoribosylglycinamide formyltransferase-1